jgi:hypothetical protein
MLPPLKDASNDNQLHHYTSSTFLGKLFKTETGTWEDANAFKSQRYVSSVEDKCIRILDDDNHADFSEALGQFNDASFQSTFDMRSVSGYCTFYAGAIVAWGSQTQPTIAQSTMESEILSTVRGCGQLLHVRTILEELGEVPHDKPTVSFEDNKAAKICLNTHTRRKGAKHFERALTSAQEWVKNGIVRFVHVKTDLQLSDCFTKNLAEPKFSMFRNQVMNISTPLAKRIANCGKS